MASDSTPRNDEKSSFIAEARRAQIIGAAITTLDEIGYVGASLAQIAKRAGISTALISYHFRDKTDLMDHTLMSLLGEASEYVRQRTQGAVTAREKLHAYVLASMAFQGTNPKHYVALLEIVFNARTPDNVPYYKLNDDEVEPAVLELQHILRDGQASGEFRAFHIDVMTYAIRGAIGEYLMNPALTNAVNLETYSEELLRIFDRVVLREEGSL
ncbi:TetR/AcrR family transcriptional regulator [Paenibacillus koleovorans]|uniref:TetR/AcrR family transcriptional regulator n=1 Tax=Paenibacillus koleovorans TaxID=121608 RepID=UPI000FDAB22F|nr:TetR/AcrR family transcriptional regulator [Paenibacillus koleovorans]